MPTLSSHDTAGACRSAAIAALAALIVLDLGMFASMLAGVQPHPPGARGPYIAATAALAGAALLRLMTTGDGAVPLVPLVVVALRLRRLQRDAVSAAAAGAATGAAR